MDQNEINDRVARGAALLDEKRPRWYEAVDLSKLNMSDRFRCILGQLYGWFSNGTDALDLHSLAADASHGFSCQESHPNCVCEELAPAWVARITALRDEYVQSLLADGWVLSRDSLTVISPATGRETPANHPDLIKAAAEQAA